MEKKSLFINFLITFLVTVVFGLLCYFNFFQKLDYRYYDALLNLKKEPSIHNLDKINNLILDKSYKDNLLYSPLNYLSMINNSLNKVIFNEQKEVEINNNLLGFISKLIINYDKEYDYD